MPVVHRGTVESPHGLVQSLRMSKRTAQNSQDDRKNHPGSCVFLRLITGVTPSANTQLAVIPLPLACPVNHNSLDGLAQPVWTVMPVLAAEVVRRGPLGQPE